MSMDTIQKIADIFQKSVIAIVLSIAGFIVTRDKSYVDMGKSCDEMYSTILKYVSENELTDRTDKLLNHRLDRYSSVCVPLSEDFITLVKSSWKEPEVSILLPPVSASGSANVIGWAAFSRIPSTKYKDTNFDRIDNPNGSPLEVGAVLAPRWQVNIRKSNTSVAQGANPVVGQLVPGDCIAVHEAVTGKLNEWVSVIIAECPPAK
jgi:hypothetical protein